MKIGLTLGGGGARGISHIVVLEVIDELGIRVAGISGSSIGSIMGMAYASGMTGAEIRDYAVETFHDRSKVASKLWGMRPSSLQDWFNPKSYAIGRIDAELILSRFTPVELLDQDIEDLPTPLAVVATDFYNGEDIVIRSGNLRRAVAASIALPMVFKPQLVNGRVAVDGGVSNPVPFDHIPAVCDRTIAVNVTGAPDQQEGVNVKIPTGFDVLMGVSQISMNTIVRSKIAAGTVPDVLIEPPISDFGVLDFLKTTAVLEAADTKRDEIKRDIEIALEGRQHVESDAAGS